MVFYWNLSGDKLYFWFFPIFGDYDIISAIMEEFINQISNDLQYISHYIEDDVYHILIKSKEEYKKCPNCHQKSDNVHCKYTRRIKDLPIGDKKVILEFKTLKMKCKNPKCDTKVFCSRYSYIGKNSPKTKRLEDKIQEISTNQSSVKKLPNILKKILLMYVKVPYAI
jgi:hypothetical protein